MISKRIHHVQIKNNHELLENQTQKDNHRLIDTRQDPLRCHFLRSLQLSLYQRLHSIELYFAFVNSVCLALPVIIQETALPFAKTKYENNAPVVSILLPCLCFCCKVHVPVHVSAVPS